MTHSRKSNELNQINNAMGHVSLGGILQSDSRNNQSNKASKSSLSTNQQAFQPMPAGIRTELWAEGFQYREFRRKNGFNHTKLEWIVPTDRT